MDNKSLLKLKSNYLILGKQFKFLIRMENYTRWLRLSFYFPSRLHFQPNRETKYMFWVSFKNKVRAPNLVRLNLILSLHRTTYYYCPTTSDVFPKLMGHLTESSHYVSLIGAQNEVVLAYEIRIRDLDLAMCVLCAYVSFMILDQMWWMLKNLNVRRNNITLKCRQGNNS